MGSVRQEERSELVEGTVEAKYSDEAKHMSLISAGLGSTLGTGTGIVQGSLEGTLLLDHGWDSIRVWSLASAHL